MKAVMTDEKCSKSLLIVISQVTAVCFETYHFHCKSELSSRRKSVIVLHYFIVMFQTNKLFFQIILESFIDAKNRSYIQNMQLQNYWLYG